MRVISETSLPVFADRVLDWLLREPVRNNVPAQLVISYSRMAEVPPGALWLSVHDGQELAGVALCVPDRPMAIAATSTPQAVDLLAAWCAEHAPELKGVNGAESVADRFAQCYAELAGVTAAADWGSRLFRLDEVVHPSGVAGTLRHPTRDAAGLITTWVTEFFAEAVPQEPISGLTEMVERKLTEGELWIWCAPEPVSMLWTNPWTGGVVRLSGVYTPPAHRGHGYASALTAAVSQRMLDDGAVACCLYTDLANPTSNKIYPAIGYQPVEDSHLWQFA